MIARADTRPAAERQRMRSLALVYAGYADHFLHDSFAAGDLANKTLIMQWYVEWLLASGAVFEGPGALLREMTYQRQPFLHGPDLYNPKPGATRPALSERKLRPVRHHRSAVGHRGPDAGGAHSVQRCVRDQ